MEMPDRSSSGDHMKLLRFVMASTLLLCSSAYAADKPIPVGIRVIDAEAAKQCHFVDTAFSQGRGSDITDIIDKMRDRAFQIGIEKGGNAIVMKNIAISSAYMVLMFDLYRCS